MQHTRLLLAPRLFTSLLLVTLGSVGAVACAQQAPAVPPVAPAAPASVLTPAPQPPITSVTVPPVLPPPLPPGAATPIPLDRPLSLPEAIALALREQPQLTISAGQVQAAAGHTLQARSAERPTASLSAQHTRSGPSNRAAVPAGASFNSGAYTTSLSARQLLFDFGRTPAQIAQARQAQLAAEQALNQTREDTVNNVKQAYYTLLQDQRLIEVQQRNLTDQQAHLDLTQARYEAKVAPRADVYRAQAAVAQALLTVVQAENAAAQARLSLNVAMGIDARLPTQVQETEEPMPALPALPELMTQAFAQRPEILQLQASVASAEAAVRAADAANRPDVNADASYGLSGATFPPDRRSWSYGVAVSWPFFDVGLTRGAIETARGNLLAAQGQLRLGQDTVAQEVTQAYLNVQAAAEQVTTAAAGVTSAEESLRVAVGRYAVGVAAYLEVIDAEAALTQAQTSQVTASYGLSMARAALARALGPPPAEAPAAERKEEPR